MPNKIELLLDLLEVPSNGDMNFGDRMSGWLVPPITGDYTFWIASEDNGELFLGLDYASDSGGDGVRICYTPGSSKSTQYRLMAGQPLYFEVKNNLQRVSRMTIGLDNICILKQNMAYISSRVLIFHQIGS